MAPNRAVSKEVFGPNGEITITLAAGFVQGIQWLDKDGNIIAETVTLPKDSLDQIDLPVIVSKPTTPTEQEKKELEEASKIFGVVVISKKYDGDHAHTEHHYSFSVDYFDANGTLIGTQNVVRFSKLNPATDRFESAGSETTWLDKDGNILLKKII